MPNNSLTKKQMKIKIEKSSKKALSSFESKKKVPNSFYDYPCDEREKKNAFTFHFQYAVRIFIHQKSIA